MSLNKTIFLFCCFLWLICFCNMNGQEAKVEGSPFDEIKNSENANVRLRIVTLVDEPDKIVFTVENMGNEDVLIHALRGNSEIKIKKPDGTYWENTTFTRTAYMRFKPGQNLIHSKWSLSGIFRLERFVAPGYYEITWIVDDKWESNTFIVYIQEPKDGAKKEPIEKKANKSSFLSDKDDVLAPVRKLSNIALDSEFAFIAEFNGEEEIMQIKRTEKEVEENYKFVQEYKRRVLEMQKELIPGLDDHSKALLMHEMNRLKNKTALYAVQTYYSYRVVGTVVHTYKGDVGDKVVIELKAYLREEDFANQKFLRANLKEGEKSYFLVVGKPTKIRDKDIYNHESNIEVLYSDRLEPMVEKGESSFFLGIGIISFLVENLEILNEAGHRELEKYNIFKDVNKKDIPAIWQKNKDKFKLKKSKFDLTEENKKAYGEMYLKK